MDTNIKEQGLLRKYIITRADGGQLDPAFEAFVLRLDDGGDPKHVEACRKAIMAYAMAIQSHLPALALDIFNRWGPAQPEGWKTHYFKDAPSATAFLIDRAVMDICNGKGVWFFTDNHRSARDAEISIRARLAEKFDRDDLNIAIHNLLDVRPLTGVGLRGWGGGGLEFASTVLVDNPRMTDLYRREGDPRKMINKRLFMMHHAQPFDLISTEVMGR